MTVLCDDVCCILRKTLSVLAAGFSVHEAVCQVRKAVHAMPWVVLYMKHGVQFAVHSPVCASGFKYN